MQKALSKVLVFVFTSSIIFPPGRCLAGSSEFAFPEPARVSSIAIVPVADGELDVESAKAAAAVADGMRLASGLHIIDSRLVADVAGYHAASGEIGPSAKAGAEALSEAKRHFFAFRADSAREALDRAFSELEGQPADSSRDGALLLDAHVTAAVFARAHGDSSAVSKHLSSALKIDHRLDLAAEEYPPSLVKALEKEKSALFSGGAGRLVVRSRPEAAEVFINGVKHGATPFDEELPAGDYRVSVRASRYEGADREVKIAAGAEVKLKERLRWLKRGSRRATEGLGFRAAVAEALRVADLMKADSVVLVNAVEHGGGVRYSLCAVDGATRVSSRPLIFDADEGLFAETMARMTQSLAVQVSEDMASKDPRTIGEVGSANPALLSKRKRPLTKRAAFWAILGTIIAGGIGGGLAAAFSGGSGDRGSVRVEFR
ncbi:MAG TPA: PEGA domain-containing protein [bacterium]|nr:PEGA domain-containing protein [bacterium]